MIADSTLAGTDAATGLIQRLPEEISNVLKRHSAQFGYAPLQGVTRAVWVLPATDIRLEKGKTARTQAVEVTDRV